VRSGVITFDEPHAAEFLSQYEELPGYLWVGMFEPKPRGDFFGTTSKGIVDAVKFAGWLEGAYRPKGIYWRVSTVREPLSGGKRGEATDTCYLPYLFADLDVGTEGHKPSRDGRLNPPTVEDAYALIGEARLPEPTAVITSGGGLYPLWRLEGGTDLDVAAAALKGVQVAIGDASTQRGWAYGNVGELARVLRLPGSVNRKTANHRRCHVIGDVR
jgi:hypothetical protein